MMRFSNAQAFTSSIAIAALAVNMTVLCAGGVRADKTLRLDAGSVIPVRLNDTLSSSDSRKGDSFTATVRRGDGEDFGLPDGTKVDGVITGARRQRDKDPGIIEVAFSRVSLPNGRSYPIDGSLIGLDNKSVDRRADGRLIAKPGHKNDRLTYAGYGAGAGLIVGLLTKRPLEDTVLGGLLGYGFGSLQKGNTNARDVVLKPGTEMGVRIDRQTVFASYDESPQFHRTQQDDPIRYRPDRPEYRRGDNRPDGIDAADVGVMVDERDVRFDSTARPIITKNDVVMVPAIPVLRTAKIPYTYDSPTQALRATGSIDPVRVAVGSNIASINGRRVRLEAPVQRINGVIYVPMKFLALATGYDVRYDAPSRTVLLNSR